MKPDVNYWSYVVQFFLEWEMFRTKAVEKIETHFVFIFFKSCLLWGDVEKHCWAGQATYDNMAHEYCMLDTYGYKHTLRICNSYCISTAILVTRTRLNVKLYVHWVSS